ncbi:blue copper protein 1a-like [Oryza brachyantha]|uniref:Phytocyanin domain-containing protein n=1 Tax=Oryza brachyantha TaxID=4533 RepID=J3MZN2_ORYBR|nr:blue copper protein 1a-like [Oryza brachyantha]
MQEHTHQTQIPLFSSKPDRSTMVARDASSSAAVLALVVAAAAAAGLAGATEYTVGDSEGWTIGPSYLAWSQKYNFTAGDTLVFSYVQRQHDVLRVNLDAFRTCDPGANQTMQRWASGRDVVELAAPGSYYFICNVSGHCLGGMKFSVAVGEPLPPPPPPPPPPRAFMAPPPPVGSGRRLRALTTPASCLALVIAMWISW